MLNLFKSKKDPGKTRKAQTSTTRTGAKTSNNETKSWFSKSPKTKPNKNQQQIRAISVSSPSLNNNNNEKKRIGVRPLSIAAENVTVRRRGQQPSKVETPTPEDLSRSSSITNLNVDQKAKGAKPKKVDSKDKLDKIVEKKHDKRSVNKNNNKESGIDSLSDVESLQKQLAQMANDKSNLALQLGEQTGQLNKLHNEIAHLKMLQDDWTQKLDQLLEENTVLRNRLRDVAHSPLSDNEKQQLLYESHRHHSSAPASIATNLLEDGGDITTCPTPEWDKHSSSNVSEVSVACLQDKINQMQETHYSTNEELQATLQELTDLQKQLTELQGENVRLNEEKNLMFDSLCRQTERLNDSRNEVESLKQLLYKDENGQFETAAEREQKLVDLLKSAQEEREGLLMKQEQLGNELEDTRSTSVIQTKEIAQLTDRVKTLESTLDAKHAEHKLLDQELAQAKDQSSSRQIEINRLKDLLENARTKIGEMEQDRTLSDKSELDELLDNARKEKDALESEVAHLKEKLALSKNENEKLKEQVSILQEECKVIRNNAKTTQSDLEYKVEKLLGEKSNLTEQLQQFQEALNELQVQAQCQVEDKRQLSAVLSETQRNLNESERRIADLENELADLKKIKQEQEEEWEKFQNDLLTSVRVANDFKTEAQQDLQKFIMENKAGRERIKQLEAQIEKLKGGSRRKSPVSRLSNEELLISSLNRRYQEISNLPDEQLTDEQKAIKVLKLHYDNDFPRQKPVAHKPKDKLAISKPSLESVISNPKLEKIVADSQIQSVETVSYFSDDEQKYRQSLSPTRLTLIDSIGASVEEINLQRNDSFPKIQSDSALEINEKQQIEIHTRSKSLSDLPNVVIEEEPTLRRFESTENLAVLSKDKKSTMNLEILEKICREIDPNLPEDQLTKEQRLALRMREVLQQEPKKLTLKKKPNLLRKKVIISYPTRESVERNTKLYQIINNPIVKTVDSGVVSKAPKRNSKISRKTKERYSMPVPRLALQDSLTESKKSRSYNDISFKFQVPDMYSGEKNHKSFELESVLPPEGFRDPAPSVANANAVFDTFQSNNNTFKREHSYLDLDFASQDDVVEENQDLEQKNDQPEDSLDGRISPEGGNVDDEVLITTQSINEPEETPKTNDSKEFDDSSIDSGDMLETINEVITRRLEQEDDLIYPDDEEILVARRGLRQRYSQVVEEFKEKFDKSSDEESETEPEPEEFNLTEEFQKLQTDISSLVDETYSDENDFVLVPVTETKDFIEVTLTESSDTEQSQDKNCDKNLEQDDGNRECGVTEIDADGSKLISDAAKESPLTNFDVELKTELSSDLEANISIDDSKDSKVYEEPFSSRDYHQRSDAEKRNIYSDLDDFDGFTIEEINSNRNSIKTVKLETGKDPNLDKNHSEILTLSLNLPNDSTTLENEDLDYQITKPEDNFKISNEINEIDLLEDKPSTEIQTVAIIASTNEDKNILAPSCLTHEINEPNKTNSDEDNSLWEAETPQVSTHFEESTSLEPEQSDLTEDELLMIENLNTDSDPRKLSEMKALDFKIIAEMTEKYLTEEPDGFNSQQNHENSNSDKNQEANSSELASRDETEIRRFPTILPPTRLSQPSSYEPVYANFDISSNINSSSRTPSFSGKKPVALPRIVSLDSDHPSYREFGGQFHKTRFSITYERKKGDSFKESNQERSIKVKEIKKMFESKANQNFRDLVDKALEEDKM